MICLETGLRRIYSLASRVEGQKLEFRLIYEGPLPAESRSRRTQYKHLIRKALHPQLRELWNQRPFLSRNIEACSDRYSRFGYRFVPLVNEWQGVYCALDILFLRRGAPGNLVGNGGDIDNRIKVLFDGLRMVQSAAELGGETPGPDEDPFFCLLQDDSLITELKVTTDTLLKPLARGEHHHDVVLVIGIRTAAIDADDI